MSTDRRGHSRRAARPGTPDRQPTAEELEDLLPDDEEEIRQTKAEAEAAGIDFEAWGAQIRAKARAVLGLTEHAVVEPLATEEDELVARKKPFSPPGRTPAPRVRADRSARRTALLARPKK